MSINFEGQVAIVTGAGNGLGRSHALALAERGAKVVVNDLGGSVNGDGGSSAAALETVAMIEAAGGEAIANGANVAKMDEVEAMVAQAVEKWGRVDILVNNAGTSQRGPFLEVSDELWQDDLDLKLFASIRLSRLVIPGMRERRWGRIINVLNVGAKMPGAEGAPTAVSRAAGMALMKVLANEGAPHNVLVNGMLVGKIRSDQWEQRHAKDPDGLSLEDWYTETGKEQPMGRLGLAQEFANMACFLASDAGSYINGAAINVDGGLCKVV